MSEVDKTASEDFRGYATAIRGWSERDVRVKPHRAHETLHVCAVRMEEAADLLAAAEAERDALRAIVQAYRDGDLPDMTAVHMAAVERGKDIMRAERDEALAKVAALTKENKVLTHRATDAESDRDVNRDLYLEYGGHLAALREAAVDFKTVAWDLAPHVFDEDRGANCAAVDVDMNLSEAITDTAAAAREWEARVVERCADIAGRAHITEHDNLDWSEGRRLAVEALRAEAARVQEGR